MSHIKIAGYRMPHIHLPCIVIGSHEEKDHDGHQQMDIMKSAFTDFKAICSMSGLLSIMNTGTLNAQQLELASRIAVKVIAVLGIKES